MSQRIGFAGLGLMGSRMARNLVKKGFETTVWNRTPARTAPLAAEGARVAATPRELAERSDVVVACVADPPAVERLVFAEDGLIARRAERLPLPRVLDREPRDHEAGAVRRCARRAPTRSRLP